MENKKFNIFKLEYFWYEGEHRKNLLGKNVETEEFEKNLIQAKKFAESLVGKEVKDYDYLGKGYSVECLPEFYAQIIWFLINKLDYIECYIDKHLAYEVDDGESKKIVLTRRKNINERIILT